MELFSKTELLIIASIVGTLLIVIVFLTILDIKEYFKTKKEKSIPFENNFKPVDNDNILPAKIPANSMTQILEEVEVLEIEEPSVVTLKEEKNIEILKEEVIIEPIKINNNEVLEITKEEAQSELERITSELEQLESDSLTVPSVTNFEIEQEENAIISMDELLKLGNNLYDKNESIQYDEGDEPITIDEVISKFNNNIQVTPLEKQDEEVKKEVYARKEKIPFISCIYGLEKNNKELEFENTASYEKLEQEIRKTNEFLDTLKDMQENKQN